MIKEGILEHQEKRNNNGKSKSMSKDNTISFSRFRSLMVKAKIITNVGINIYKGNRQF